MISEHQFRKSTAYMRRNVAGTALSVDKDGSNGEYVE